MTSRQQHQVAGDPHERPAPSLVGHRRRAPGPQNLPVVRVQQRPGAVDRQRRERVHRPRHEHVQQADGVGHPPRSRIEADHRPPEQQAGAQVEDVLERVHHLVLERGLVQGREVRADDRRGEQSPGHEGMREHLDRPRVQNRQQDPAPEPRLAAPQGQRHGGAQQEGRRHHRGQQDVLDHVDPQEVLGVDVDRRRQGHQHQEQPRHEPDRAAARPRPPRVAAGHPANTTQVQPPGRHDRHQHERLEGPRGQHVPEAGLRQDLGGKERHAPILRRRPAFRPPAADPRPVRALRPPVCATLPTMENGPAPAFCKKPRTH